VSEEEERKYRKLEMDERNSGKRCEEENGL
jgi:hypothetical protein